MGRHRGLPLHVFVTHQDMSASLLEIEMYYGRGNYPASAVLVLIKACWQ